MSIVEPKPGTAEYAKCLEEWYKTDSYKQFCEWWRAFGRHHLDHGRFSHDFVAGDIWRAIENKMKETK